MPWKFLDIDLLIFFVPRWEVSKEAHANWQPTVFNESVIDFAFHPDVVIRPWLSEMGCDFYNYSGSFALGISINPEIKFQISG